MIDMAKESADCQMELFQMIGEFWGRAIGIPPEEFSSIEGGISNTAWMTHSLSPTHDCGRSMRRMEEKPTDSHQGLPAPNSYWAAPSISARPSAGLPCG